MASDVDLPWEVEGSIDPPESIECMLKFIASKGKGGDDEGGRASRAAGGEKAEEVGAATFWTWEGNRYPW